jgi:hypothetical protein
MLYFLLVHYFVLILVFFKICAIDDIVVILWYISLKTVMLA